jgi:hypothetical protein
VAPPGRRLRHPCPAILCSWVAPAPLSFARGLLLPRAIGAPSPAACVCHGTIHSNRSVLQVRLSTCTPQPNAPWGSVVNRWGWEKPGDRTALLQRFVASLVHAGCIATIHTATHYELSTVRFRRTRKWVSGGQPAQPYSATLIHVTEATSHTASTCRLRKQRSCLH